MEHTQILKAAYNRNGQAGLTTAKSFSGTLSFAVYFPDPVLGQSFSVRLSYSSLWLFSDPSVAPVQKSHVEIGAAVKKMMENSCVFFAPSIGAVIYNWKWNDSRGVNKSRLSDVMVATLLLGHMGPRRLSFGAAAPFNKTKAAPLLPEALKEVVVVDPLADSRKAALGLLKRNYPMLATAIKSGKPGSKPFCADVVRLTGSLPAEMSTGEREFVAMLSDAWKAFDARDTYKRRRGKGKKVSAAVDYYITQSGNWSRLHCMELKQIADEVGKATDVWLTPDAVQNHIDRLKLTRNCRRGRRVNK